MHCTPIGLVDFSSDGLDVLINDINDTRREKSPSNKTPGLTKSTNIDIWVIGTSNQLFIRGS